MTGLIGCRGTDCLGSSENYRAAVTVVLGLGGTLAGAGIGAVAGSYVHTERWERVRLP